MQSRSEREPVPRRFQTAKTLMLAIGSLLQQGARSLDSFAGPFGNLFVLDNAQTPFHFFLLFRDHGLI